MLLNTLVFVLVLSSTRLKPVRGAGEAVNGNDVVPSGVASLMIVIEPGKTTAAADSARSWFPPLPSSEITRVWNGSPEMVTAELSNPQSTRVEMCPPHASTGFATLALKVISI